jgi:AcrR family transcriptional regulator
MTRPPAAGPAGSIRDRILGQALSEFARYGFSGARVDRIARLARVSKRMLFYYFKDKQELFGAVLDSAWQDGQVMQEAPEDAIASARFWREFYFRNENFLRLMQWESIEPGPKGLMGAKDRQRIWRASVQKIRRGSSRPGGWPKSMDPRYVLILGLGLIAAPLLLPTVTRLSTGLDPHDPRFRRKHAALVDEIIARVIGAQLTPPRRARRSAKPAG